MKLPLSCVRTTKCCGGCTNCCAKFYSVVGKRLEKNCKEVLEKYICRTNLSFR